jgi:hypothetical protein
MGGTKMIRLLNFALIFWSVLLIGNTVVPGCNRSDSGNADARFNSSGPTSTSLPKSDIETIAQGIQSGVPQPFVAVIRESSVYDELRKTVSGLPARDAEAFKKTAVIAAFLGERLTAGYGISISQSADGVLKLSETVPPKGTMLAQVITSPFGVYAVSLPNPETQVVLELTGAWKSGGKVFDLTTGEFTMVGGFAGQQEPFQLEGHLNLLRLGNLVSIIFDIQARDAKKPRSLRTIATGIIKADTNINLPVFDSGTLIDRPRPFLSATGTFASDASSLTLKLQSLVSLVVADGYVGQGSLKALASTEKQK